MTTPYDDPLYRDPELAQFYDMDNEWRADFDMYLTRAATAGRILDLGCGTGTLMAAIAEKYPDKILTGAAYCCITEYAASFKPGWHCAV